MKIFKIMYSINFLIYPIMIEIEELKRLKVKFSSMNEYKV